MIFFFLALIFFLLGWSIPFLTSTTGLRRWKKEGQLVLEQALLEKQKILQSAEREVNEQKQKAHAELEKETAEHAKRQKALHQKESVLKRKEDELAAQSHRLDEKRKRADSRLQELDEKEALLEKELQQVAHLSQEEAYNKVIEQLKEKQKAVFLEHKNSLLQDLVEEEKKRIRSAFEESLTAAFTSRTSHPHITVLKLTGEDSIPRLIGKEGKNIEGLASLVGCDLWVDDERRELIIASYDDEKRFFAERLFMEMLAKDTFTLNQAYLIKNTLESNIEKEFAKKGLEAVREVSLFHTYPEPILSALGKLSLRSSHGQNVLLHSIETAKMARVAAVELGLVPDLSAQIGLFHDIGKGLDYSWGQRHPERGKAFLQHHACDQKICDGVASHHSSCPHTTFESMLIPPLDALSAKGCIKRLMHHNSPFKKLQHSIETLPFVKSAWCVDAHNKILLIIRLRDHSFDIVQLEETISQEKLFLPLDVQIYPHHTTPSTNAPIKTLIFFPEKN